MKVPKCLGYGPSETTNICTVRPFVVESDKINNLGPPLRNTSAFAISPNSFDIVPQGGIGEFCFGGDQVFRGYLNMPSLNDQKIMQHPKFGRLYRSGDYGRILSDGSLEFHGRQDDQVKIRGQRVELGEISTVLLQSAKVADVVTLIDPSPQCLLTFWVPNGCCTDEWHILNDEDLWGTLQELFLTLISSLPTYMIPSLLIPIPYIPMTGQGKIDKRRLKMASSRMTHEQSRHFAHSTKQYPDENDWSMAERIISQALSTTTGCMLQDIGRHVSFFSLGLDSISAISFSRSLREQGFHEADVSIVLRHPSVSKLGERLAREAETLFADKFSTRRFDEYFSKWDVEKIVCKFHGKRVSKILPCTPLQEAMLSCLNLPGKMPYYNHTVFEIHGDVDQLHHAWQQMASKHDILRTCFTPTENERFSFAQVVLSSYRLDWKSIQLEDDDLNAALENSISRIIRDGVEDEPQYWFTAFKTPQKTVLLLSMHHSLYDGEAFQLLLNDVTATYDGHCPLPPVSYEPFLSVVHSLDLDEADSFWNMNLQNFKSKTFSAASVGATMTQAENCGSVTTTLLSSASLHSLADYCKRLQVSMLSLVQASWAKVLSLFLDTTDVCFGNVVSGRTLPLDGIERIVAPCFNTVPVRLQLATDMSNMELMKTAQQLNLDLLPFQFTPLRRIYKMKTTQNPRLFDTLLILQKPQQPLNNHIWSVERDVGVMDVGV